MFGSIKKRILIGLNLLLIPFVNAQTSSPLGQTAGVLEGTFKGVFELLGGILGGIFGGFLYLIKKDTLYGRIFISIVAAIIIYDRLRTIEQVKERAGILAFVIGLITALGLPDNLINGIFANNAPGLVLLVGMIFAAIMLVFAKGDTNWGHFLRFVSYLMLTIGFAGIVTYSGSNEILLTGSGLLTAGFAIAAIWNLLRLKWVKTGIGESLWKAGTRDIGKDVSQGLKEAVPTIFDRGHKKEQEFSDELKGISEMEIENIPDQTHNLDSIKEYIKKVGIRDGNKQQLIDRVKALKKLSPISVIEKGIKDIQGFRNQKISYTIMSKIFSSKSGIKTPNISPRKEKEIKKLMRTFQNSSENIEEKINNNLLKIQGKENELNNHYNNLISSINAKNNNQALNNIEDIIRKYNEELVLYKDIEKLSQYHHNLEKNLEKEIVKLI